MIVDVLVRISFAILSLCSYELIDSEPEESVRIHVADIEDFVWGEVRGGPHVPGQNCVREVSVRLSLFIQVFGEQGERPQDVPVVGGQLVKFGQQHENLGKVIGQIWNLKLVQNKALVYISVVMNLYQILKHKQA